MAMAPDNTHAIPNGMWIPTTARKRGSVEGISTPKMTVDPSAMRALSCGYRIPILRVQFANPPVPDRLGMRRNNCVFPRRLKMPECRGEKKECRHGGNDAIKAHRADDAELKVHEVDRRCRPRPGIQNRAETRTGREWIVS